MTHNNFQIVLKISLAMIVEIVHLALRTVIDSFEICTINSLIEEKFRYSFHCVQNFIRASRTKTEQ